ncbi:sensor histidine kinase [Adhaeribacter aquaticus]|uniref:sensor histidine kinase n=1 Tax=Adhaeribacter aquaticus TaxID=299567 RepID=UPI0003F6D7B3|nr:HAMP domain-containing sensor histidine kinase [Adhaeribacter aquaticus]
MFNFLQKLLESSEFMPHGHCYLWRSDILWLTVIGDGLTGLAYFTLPLMLFYIVKKRQDLIHRNLFMMFGIFIMACGATHFVDIWTIWNPTYRLASVVTMFTGLVSVAAAVTLFRTIPAILALPSPIQQDATNAELRAQIEEREKAQTSLRQINDELEIRVQQRTAQLIRANRDLEQQIENRKRAERDLIAKNGELIRINGDLDNFVYCASHDLKSPVVNAEGLVTALREELPSDIQGVQDLLGRLDLSIRQMHRTIQDLTEVSTLQKNTDKSDFEILNFSKVLDEVKISLADKIGKAGVTITGDFSQVDEVRFTHKNLTSIIFNLVSNAIKYRSPDRAPVIQVSSQDAGDYVMLAVADNGIGMDLIKHEKKIFSLFKRLHDNIEGSGVGLFIVKRIMEYNQGRVEVESKPGEGTTFKIFFPKRIS